MNEEASRESTIRCVIKGHPLNTLELADQNR